MTHSERQQARSVQEEDQTRAVLDRRLAGAVCALAPAVLGCPVVLPPTGEYVALGAARQAAWALAGTDRPPTWPAPETTVLEATPTPHVREVYADLRDRTAHHSWNDSSHDISHDKEGTA